MPHAATPSEQRERSADGCPADIGPIGAALLYNRGGSRANPRKDVSTICGPKGVEQQRAQVFPAEMYHAATPSEQRERSADGCPADIGPIGAALLYNRGGSRANPRKDVSTICGPKGVEQQRSRTTAAAPKPAPRHRNSHTHTHAATQTNTSDGGPTGRIKPPSRKRHRFLCFFILTPVSAFRNFATGKSGFARQSHPPSR